VAAFTAPAKDIESERWRVLNFAALTLYSKKTRRKIKILSFADDLLIVA
jgi:hypothetical protein